MPYQIFLYPGEQSNNDIRLRDPTQLSVPPAAPGTNPLTVPFFVPKIDQDTYWYGISNRSGSLGLLTNQTMFGQGGQVTTRNWESIYNFDNSFVSWSGPNRNNSGLLAAQVNPFKPIVSQFYNDDASIWQQRSQRAIISSIPKTINLWSFGYNDAPTWSYSPVNSAPIQILTAGGQPHTTQWHYDNDDFSIWSQSIQRDLVLTTITFSPFKIHQWAFGYNDALVWQQPTAQRNAALPFVPEIINQWSFGYDDSLSWSYSPIDAAPIQILTAGGQPHTKRWRYNNDDFSIWSLSIQRDLALTTIISSPFSIHQWPFGYDDSLGWSGEPNNANLATLFLVPYETGNEYFIHRNRDNDPIWYGQTIDVPQTLTVTTAAGPSSLLFGLAPNYQIFADFIGWDGVLSPNNANVAAMFLVPYETGNEYFIHRNRDSDPLWGGRSYNVSQTLSVGFTPYETGNEYFSYRSRDNDTLWGGQPSNVSQPLSSGFILYETGNEYFIYRNRDDYSFWGGFPLSIPEPLSFGLIPYETGNEYFGYRNQISDPIWSSSLRYNYNLITPTQSSPISCRAPFYNPRPDDFFWKRTSQKSPALLSISAAPFTIRQWQFGYNDSSVWVGQSDSAYPIPMLTVGGITKAKQWHWDNDDPSMWSGWANRNSVSALSVPSNPLIPVLYRLHTDDSAIWQQPSQRNVGLPFVPVIVDHWKIDISDDQSWSLTAQRDLGINTIQPNPFISVTWRFNNDDAPFWKQHPQRSVALPFVPAIINHWRLDPINDQLWSIRTQYNISAQSPFVVRWYSNTPYDQIWSGVSQRDLSLFVTPFGAKTYSFISDDQIWSGTSQRSDLSLYVTPFGTKPYIPVTDDQFWSMTIQRDLSLSVTPFGTKTYGSVIDDPIWSMTSQRIIVTVVPPINNRWHLEPPNDLVWQSQGQQRSRVYFFKPEIPSFWLFNNDDPSLSWRQALQRSAGVGTLPQYPPFIIRQPSFAHDDHSSYQWPMKSEIILSLRWNTQIERIVKTCFENRIINASSEKRIVKARDEDDSC